MNDYFNLFNHKNAYNPSNPPNTPLDISKQDEAALNAFQYDVIAGYLNLGKDDGWKE